MDKTIKLKHESITSFSINGVQYDANDKGVFELPEDVAAQASEAFGGFTVAGRGVKVAGEAQ